ncbi:MAG: hypothetical protein V3U62_04900 [Sedimenticolaceae bacterium]
MRGIAKADLLQPLHAEALVYLLNLYALDPMGGGKALSGCVKENLASALNNREDARCRPFARVLCGLRRMK